MMDDLLLREIDRAAELLRRSRNLLVITGAGVSADSGLPTYRGVGGLYDVDDTEDGLPIEMLLSGEMMSQRPELTWKYLGQIARACSQATFNRGHEVIAFLERRFERVVVLTQNVDGFHRSAGSTNVIDIHGDLHDLLCTACGSRRRVESTAGLDLPPRCPPCGAMERPDVVLFGELLPEEKLAKLWRELETGFDAVLTIGTTSVFPYIAEPVRIARRAGQAVIEINPGESDVSHLADVRLRTRAAAALDAVWQRLSTTAADRQ